MIGRRERRRPTWVEFFERLVMALGEFALLWRFYRTLRRRGLGQTSALIGALIALDKSQCDIAMALGCRRRRVAGHWRDIQDRFSLSGVGGLVRFLHDKDAWPEGRRSRPTPQQRPFARPGESRKRLPSAASV